MSEQLQHVLTCFLIHWETELLSRAHHPLSQNIFPLMEAHGTLECKRNVLNYVWPTVSQSCANLVPTAGTKDQEQRTKGLVVRGGTFYS